MDGGGERHACTAIAAAAPQPAEQPSLRQGTVVVLY